MATSLRYISRYISRGWKQMEVVRSYGTRQESKPWKQKPNKTPRLSVILKKDVYKLGVKGQIVKVRRGYGRNYLLPKKMAAYVTPWNIEALNAFTREKGASSVNKVDYFTNFLSDKTLLIEHDPDSKSAVFEQHISRAFQKQHQLHVPLDCIELEEPITDFTAQHSVEVKLDNYTSVTVPVKVELVLSKKKRRKLEREQAKQATT